MRLSEIKIVDLRFSELDEKELEQALEQKKRIEKRIKQTKDEAKLAKLKEDLEKVDEEANKWKLLYEKERKEQGFYRFKEDQKHYINYGAPGTRPEYWFSWCRYEPTNGFRDLNEWRHLYGYVPVDPDADPYWPESVEVNAAGHYQFGDLVLVKCPLLRHLERRFLDIRLAMGGAKKKIEEFNRQMLREGGGLDERELLKILGEEPEEPRLTP